jgi:hypothetical protein
MTSAAPAPALPLPHALASNAALIGRNRLDAASYLQQIAVLPRFTTALVRNVERWNKDLAFALAQHNATNQQAAAKTASASSSSAGGSCSKGSGSAGAAAPHAKLTYDDWDTDLEELRAALAAAGLPPLPSDLFVATDLAAIVTAAAKLADDEPTDTGTNVEVRLVHPCVADVLELLFETLKKSLIPPDEALAPYTALLKHIWLYLECRPGKHQKMSRLPDGGFLARAASTAGYVFDDSTPEWMLVSIENKRSFGSLNQPDPGAYDDAINGVQRDHACTLKLPCESLPYGLGVISDGRTYRLVRTEMSPTVKSAWSRPYNFRVGADVQAFLTLLAHAVLVAATRSYVHKYDLPKCELDGREVQVRAVLASSSNSVVFRFTLGFDKLIGKFVVGDDVTERFDREQAVWREHGALLAESHFVRRASLPERTEQLWEVVSTFVYVDDGSTPLRDVRKDLAQPRPGERGSLAAARLDALKTVVVRDVSAALKHLHAHGLAFVDVHPGQIVVKTDAEGNPTTALLVDVETIQRFEASVPAKRRVWCARNFEPRQMSVRPVSAETDAESFALTLAWLLSGVESDDKNARLRSLPDAVFDDIQFGVDGPIKKKPLLLQWRGNI